MPTKRLGVLQKLIPRPGDGRVVLAVFMLGWTFVVLVPLLGAAVTSFLQTRGIAWTLSPSLNAYNDIIFTGRWEVIVRTLLMSGLVTLVSLAVGFPFALWLAKHARSGWLKQATFIAMTVPLFLDPSARTLVWRALLGTTGIVNTGLIGAGLIDAPLDWLLFSNFAVAFGLIAPYFPNMVWPIYLAILLIDDELIAAARDIGASPFQALRDVIVPLSLSGVAAGIVFTFVPVLGDNVATRLLGGGKKEYLADSVTSLVTTMNYSGAAAFATIVLALTAIFIGMFGVLEARARGRQ